MAVGRDTRATSGGGRCEMYGLDLRASIYFTLQHHHHVNDGIERWGPRTRTIVRIHTVVTVVRELCTFSRWVRAQLAMVCPECHCQERIVIGAWSFSDAVRVGVRSCEWVGGGGSDRMRRCVARFAFTSIDGCVRGLRANVSSPPRDARRGSGLGGVALSPG